MFSALAPKADIARQHRLSTEGVLSLQLDPAGGKQRPDIDGAHNENPLGIRIVLRAAETVGGRNTGGVHHSEPTVVCESGSVGLWLASYWTLTFSASNRVHSIITQ